MQKNIVKARKELPELLSYTAVTPARFIDQVEERSSLLIQTGLEENENCQLVPTYEFSHLSFQEYLTAKAIVKLWIPESEGNDAVEILAPYINDEHWREVIPMAAVLLGRQARPLIERLIAQSLLVRLSREDELENLAPLCLANCVANEVPMNQELLERAIVLVMKNRRIIRSIRHLSDIRDNINVYDAILKSKYGKSYCEIAERKLFSELEEEYIYEFCEAWKEKCYSEHQSYYDVKCILNYLGSEDYQEQITGALLMMENAYDRVVRKKGEDGDKETIEEIYKNILRLLQKDSSLSIYSAAWCIAWSGYGGGNFISPGIATEMCIRLVDLWVNSDMSYELRRMVSWGIVSVCIPSFRGDILQDIIGLEEIIEQRYKNPENEYDEWAAIELGILLKLWSKEETRRRIKAVELQVALLNNRFLRQRGFSVSDEERDWDFKKFDE